ncbi:MAG: hypothetical protein QG673_1738 [Pseudomonadota bacterium]|nr:hypothetical protein [Pseudomonadota bacterium]
MREIHALYESKFKNYDLQRGQFIFLTRIYENPGISLTHLSYELKLDKTTITRAIQKLIDSGYLIKQQDESDKRVWHLFSTDKCKKLYHDIIAEKNRMISICFNGVSEGESDIFRKIVNVILNNISNEWDKTINKNITTGE